MKNTSNIYELWNDVKDLLQTRLETLDQGLHSHRFRDKILVLNHWTNEIQAKLVDIKILNGSEETRQTLEDMKVSIFLAGILSLFSLLVGCSKFLIIRNES